jgi:hypothetical protein
MTTISFTPASLLQFTKLYNQKRNSTEAFSFHGQQFVPAYARYLIEYAAGQMGLRFQIDAAGEVKLGRN